MGLDRRERAGELLEGLQVAQEGHQARVWTALPGILQSFDPAKKTCTVQPAIRALVTKADLSTEWVTLPLLVDCPVQFQGGGGFTLTFPLAQGDEGLVVFSSRCIDAWWQSGGIQVQAELRMHSLSDGFFIPGVSSVPNVQPAISTAEAQLRTDDGALRLRLSPTEIEMDVNGTGSVRVRDSRVDITGVLWINGERYVDHKHTGITIGGDLTGPKA